MHKELCYGMDSVNSSYHFEYLVLARGNPWVKENTEFEQPPPERVDVDYEALFALSEQQFALSDFISSVL